MPLLANVPNIPRFAVTLDLSDGKAFLDTLRYQDQDYAVEMFYVIHTECGYRITAFILKRTYLQLTGTHRGSKRSPGVVFCPNCSARVGKSARKQLETHGKLYNFHGPGKNSLNEKFVSAYYIFPRGVELNNAFEIVGIDHNYVLLDDDESEKTITEE